MSRCFDCHWFEMTPPVGRQAQPCSELGELAQNVACPQFAEKIVGEKQTPILPRRVIPPEEGASIIGALMDENYLEIFGEVLAESFALEQDATRVVEGIQTQLRTQGVNPDDYPCDEFTRVSGKLIDLYIVYRLILAIGLVRYSDDIMAAEIAKRFGPETSK